MTCLEEFPIESYFLDLWNNVLWTDETKVEMFSPKAHINA